MEWTARHNSRRVPCAEWMNQFNGLVGPAPAHGLPVVRLGRIHEV